jgi:sugar phosphate isomerase/epimerase
MELADVMRMARDAGFQAIELMVTKREETQSAERVRVLCKQYGLTVDSIHAPFLMAAKRVWGDYLGKIERSVEMAERLGAGVVVVHLPYFWQWDYARWAHRHLTRCGERNGVILAVENAMLLKLRRTWNLSLFNSLHDLGRFQNLAFDTSHFAVAGVDIFHAWNELQSRVRHVHLSNNYLKGFDDHALPFEGRLPLARFISLLSREGFGGKVALELGPGPLEARLGEERIVRNLRHSLAFCREAAAAGARD